MHILVVCSYGKNRSVYLKKYLQQQGYDAEAVGVNDEQLPTMLEQADVVVTVHPDILRELQRVHDVTGKKIISLNVDDRPEHVLPEGQKLDGELWVNFQEMHVYPKLVEQIRTHIPLL